MHPEQFTTLCTVFADTSKVKKERKVRAGSVFYIQDFKIVLLCGLTEFQAQISWMEGVSQLSFGFIWMHQLITRRIPQGRERR